MKAGTQSKTISLPLYSQFFLGCSSSLLSLRKMYAVSYKAACYHNHKLTRQGPAVTGMVRKSHSRYKLYHVFQGKLGAFAEGILEKQTPSHTRTD